MFERKQLVQTLIFLGVPLTKALTGLTLAFHVLFALLWEWLTFIPKVTPFPQISHFLDIYRTSFSILSLTHFVLNWVHTRTQAIIPHGEACFKRFFMILINIFRQGRSFPLLRSASYRSPAGCCFPGRAGSNRAVSAQKVRQ